MFIDEVEVYFRAGDGGNGATTFRREKHVPRGGPDGGDGGRGGSLFVETSLHLSTLIEFRPGKVYRADRGGDGLGKKMSGKNGGDMILKCPVGTQIKDIHTGAVLADLTRYPQRELIAKGGHGGRGNQHFVSSIQQAPAFAEKGEPGENYDISLELKLLADVGLLGFPNVGKSTLLSRVSAAKPKIADYHFTTLVPNLGVVRVDDDSNFVMADIPGLIEGASEGAGIGIRFLKHLERTRMLIHLVDISGMTGREPLDDYRIINHELAEWSAELAALPQVIALSRTDIISEPGVIEHYKAHFESLGMTVFPISSVSGENITPLIWHVHQMLEKIPRTAISGDIPAGVVYITPSARPADEDPKNFTVERDEAGVLVVSGKGLERIIAMTDMDNEIAVRRLQRRLERLGVFKKLKAANAAEGDTVRIREVEFDYIDDEAPDEIEEMETFE
ncbi:MAG: GTPase ObgE [Armatimonadetes bacterium]|nr:GTPase ObgE [Armatimonadota bacterium]